MPAPDQGQGSSDYPVRSVAPSQLAGSDPSAQSDTPNQPGQGQSAGPDEGLKQAATIIRQMQTGCIALAKQFPAAARSLRQAETELRSAMRAIISSPGGSEPTPPDVTG
jgi:hypothetical protein